jgi:uncharacterized protein (DUF2336 family)
MSAAVSLIPELEDVVRNGTAEKRAEKLRQVTTLFLEDAPRFNDDHIRLFDDVFGQLIEEIEARARAELARRLAPVENAPLEILRRLAKDDDIAVAGPVLEQSPRLGDADLLDVARSKGQAHLFAISNRSALDEAVTEVLVRRGDRDVIRNIAGNHGARFSESSYSSLVKRAEKDGALAETVAQRPDIPDHLFRELLTRATEVVQRRLLAAAKPETQAEIRRVLAKVSEDVGAKAKRDYSAAQKTVRELKQAGKLGEAELADFARSERFEEIVATLCDLCGVPLDVIDRLMGGERPDPVLILCKAAGFSWTTARAIILARPVTTGKSSSALEAAFANFDKLSASTAKRVVRFWQAGNSSIA